MQDTTTSLGPRTFFRAGLGGTLMGLANLVPGISGGTMLLAAGVYPNFVNGIAELSTFRFRRTSMIVLGVIVVAAMAAIVLLAGLISGLVVDHRWVMYSLFIGLTLGGVPILLSMLKPLNGRTILFTLLGVGVMAAMALLGPSDSGGTTGGAAGFLILLLAGIAGASAMVLPGVSGSYLLLVLGQYLTILGAVAAVKEAIKGGGIDALRPALPIIIPVGIGVVIGVVVISNLIRFLLAKYERATLGVLLGLLLGAVIGLWPFQSGVAPEAGASFRGDRVVERDGALFMEATGREIEAKDWPTEFFRPNTTQIGGAAALIVAGFLVSLGVTRLGRDPGSEATRDTNA